MRCALGKKVDGPVVTTRMHSSRCGKNTP